MKEAYPRIAQRRGTKTARAAARKLLTLVFYGLRDEEIRFPYAQGSGVRFGPTVFCCELADRHDPTAVVWVASCD